MTLDQDTVDSVLPTTMPLLFHFGKIDTAVVTGSTTLQGLELLSQVVGGGVWQTGSSYWMRDSSAHGSIDAHWTITCPRTLACIGTDKCS